MKNVQAIDGAVNCDYHVWSVSDRDFNAMFPNERDIEFAEDFVRRVGAKKASTILGRMWRRPVLKREVNGIHGTIFFGLAVKKRYYPTRKELEITSGLPPAFRKLLERRKKAGRR